MKKLILIAVLAFSQIGMAQDYFFRNDVTLGGAFTLGKMKSGGISVASEPKFFFNENIAVGARLEADILFGGKVLGASEEISVGMSSRVAILGKGEYYFGESNTKPYVGLNLGYYTQANIGATGSGGASVSASRGFGGAPEVGIAFGGFRLSAMYHMVPGKDIVNVSVGDAVEIGRSYFVVQLSFKTFQFGG